MSKSGDYLWDRGGEDPEVARLEQLLAPLAHDAPLAELRVRRKRRVWIPLAVAGVAAAALAIVIAWPRGHRSAVAAACGARASGFAFTARGGEVVCGGTHVPAGVLPVGGTLDTGAHAAELAIADIGTAELSPNTRVRLDRTGRDRHQLYLERGRIHAVVTAPPRLFAVGTPSGQVTDLGCAYTLAIDEHGAGSIDVQAGMVELETLTGPVIVVPAGAGAHLSAGRRASLPLSRSANPQLVAAVRAYHDGTGDIAGVLASATPSDAITIANLVRVAPADARRTVLDRLQELFPAPQEMSVEDIEALDLFEMWFDEVVFAQITRD